MKKISFFKPLMVAMAAVMLITSCDDDDNLKKVIKDGDTLSSDITEDYTIDGDITISGEIHVKNGATLKITAGSTITAESADLSYILVEQGSRIEAEGTAEEPIVFTADVHEAGAWGGLHICGFAPINKSGGTGSSEIGESTYGGNVSDDDSGILKYVIVKYSGTLLDEEHEANGISFYGVGSGTTVDYINIYEGADDGIEFFGGTVNISHVYVYGAQDDSFDWTQGWCGNGQYLVAIQGEIGDRGFEGDNNGSDNTATPYANPTFSQVTLIGLGNEGNYGMKLREGTKGHIVNFIVTGFDKRSIHVEHDQTLLNVVDGSLVVDYGYVNNVVSDQAIKYSASEVDGVSNAKPDNLADYYFENSANITLTDLTSIDESQTYSGGVDASTLGSFFAADDQIGAGTDWASSWVSGSYAGTDIVTLQGDITSDVTLSGTAYITGEVHVKAGATVTVEPGTKVIALASDLTYLLIEQGAQIDAEGTADSPIVFTSNVHEAGAWGGLHLCGYAPINKSGGTGSSEIGEATYGGDASDDNSGILKYVVVEYSGTLLDEEHEANGISFYGVGNGTTVDYVQIYEGADDGIEFFGGTVNIKHTMVYGAQDDSFDWTQGWCGKGQYLLAVQGAIGDRGFEGDNSGSDNTATPYANPTLTNITLIGAGNDGNYGMKLREGTKGYITNFIVTGFDKRSIHVEHDQTLLNVVDGSLVCDYGYVNNNVTDAAIKYSASEVDGVANDKPANLADYYFENSANIFLGDYTSVDMSTTYTGGVDMSAVDADFFESNTTIGSGSDWTADWTTSIE